MDSEQSDKYIVLFLFFTICLFVCLFTFFFPKTLFLVKKNALIIKLKILGTFLRNMAKNKYKKIYIYNQNKIFVKLH